MPALETSIALLALWAIIGYVAGSIPFGMLLARAMNLGNLRDIGSGSIGATNVLRTGSKKAAALTLLLDAAKGGVVILIARTFAGEDAAQIAGFMAMVGHCYPVWLKFNGGKGVATFLGLALALAWPVGIACCLTWLAIAAVLRTSSISSMTSAVAAPIYAVILGFSATFFLFIGLTGLILWRHQSNIQRVLSGTEPKIGQK